MKQWKLLTGPYKNRVTVNTIPVWLWILIQLPIRLKIRIPMLGLWNMQRITVLYCVITRVEVNQLKRIISEADVSAFVTISEVSEIIGNHVKSSSAAIDEKALNQ